MMGHEQRQVGCDARGGSAAHRRQGAIWVSLLCALVVGAVVATTPAHSALIAASAPRVPQPDTQAASATTYAELLRLIPDTPETRQEVVINDYARLRSIRNLSAPAVLTDRQQKQAFLDALLSPDIPIRVRPAFVSGMGRSALTVTIENYLGYRRVDQDIAAGLPPRLYTAARGAFDPLIAGRQIASCVECPAPEQREAEGVPYYSWGEDFVVNRDTALLPPAFDELGRGGRYVITSQYVLCTVWTGGIHEMIAATRGSQSLADVEEFRLAAAAGAWLGTYFLVISDRTQGPQEAARIVSSAPVGRRPPVDGGWQPSAGTAVLEPYVAFAMGAGIDGTGAPYTGIVLIHATEQTARDNAALLPRRINETASTITGRPWTDLFSDVEVQVDGRVLSARLLGRAVADDFWRIGDPLLLHR